MPFYFIFQFSVCVCALAFFPSHIRKLRDRQKSALCHIFSHSPDEHSIFILFLSLFHALIYCLLRVNITVEKKKMPIKGAENRNAAIHPKIKSTQSTETERYRNGLICEFEYAVRACRKSLCCCFAVSARFFCTLSLEFFLFLGCCVILKFVGKWAFPSDTYHQAIRDEPQRTMYKHSLDSNSVFRIPSIMIMGTRTNVYRAHSLFLSLLSTHTQ